MDIEVCRLLRRHSLFHLSVVRELISHDICTIPEFVDKGENVLKEIILPAYRRRQLPILQSKDVDVPLLRARAVLLAASDLRNAKWQNTEKKTMAEIEKELAPSRL